MNELQKQAQRRAFLTKATQTAAAAAFVASGWRNGSAYAEGGEVVVADEATVFFGEVGDLSGNWTAVEIIADGVDFLCAVTARLLFGGTFLFGWRLPVPSRPWPSWACC